MRQEACYEICEDNDNGIVKWVTGDEEYTFWTHADFIKDEYIIDFLEERFPGKLVARELNLIDFTIPEENLPIEVQATSVNATADHRPKYSEFEQLIQKQINQNIISYGVCWFFFDSELLRAMKNACRNMSINMVWFREYMKEDKLKVFTVRYDGIIEEKEYNDFDFLSEVSQTCSIAAKTDEMILNDNKLKIYTNIVKMHGFVQTEIEKFYSDWRKYRKINKISGNNKNDNLKTFLSKQNGDREKLYSYILRAMGDLLTIDDILGLKDNQSKAKFLASIMGIFDVKGGGTRSITTFVDRPNICQYFPSYPKNRETWKKLKGHSLNPRQFDNIIKNGVGNYFWYEEDKNDLAIESNIDSDQDQIDKDTSAEANNKDDNNKEVNFEIKSKGQIITVNIKKDETAGW